MKNLTALFLLFVLQTPSIAQLPLTGLVAWYPFCGNANDYSGNGRNLTVVGPVLTADRFGSSKSAYYFNGSTTGVNNSLHCTPPMPTDASDFTYSCWLLPDTVGNMQIVANGNCNIAGYELTIIGATCCSSVGNNVAIVFGGINMYLPTAVTLHQWHHAVVRRTINNFDLFIDTVLVGSFTGTFNTTSPSQDFAVGQNYSYGTNSFLGKIDDIAVYDRALTITEIRQLYHYNPDCFPVIGTICDSISLPDSIKLCKNSAIVLPAKIIGPGAPSGIRWTPATGLTDPTILNPSLTVGTSSGWYYITVNSAPASNLVVNGDFSSGNTGFSSGYTYGSGPGSLVPPGVYSISTDPHNEHTGAASFHDYTTGSGNMLAVNGASTPVDVWCETISVTPNTYYNFSAWFANWSSDITANFPVIQLKINGALTGPVFAFPHPDGLWTQFSTTWYSGPNTSISLCINDQQTSFAGNDFAVDGISFGEVCTATDSIYIAVLTQDSINTSANITRCRSDGPVTLEGPVGYTSYLWNSGYTTPDITVNVTGTYWVTGHNSSCRIFIDTFHLSFNPGPIVSLGNDTSICNGTAITLSVEQSPSTEILWSNGSSNSSITVSNSGLYKVSVTVDGCKASDSIYIKQITAPMVKLGGDTTLCAGDYFSLEVNTDDTKCLWSDGSSGKKLEVSNAGTYWVNLSNICGSAGDTINVTYDFCNIWFPSAFTPNGDGRNDIIRVVGSLNMFKNFSLSIFNRFGQRVFFTNDIYQGWDGLFNGTQQDLGTYFYLIHYNLNGAAHMLKGDLELIK